MGEARLKSRKKRELPLVSFLHKTADCLIYSVLFFHTLRYSLIPPVSESRKIDTYII